LDVVLCGFTFAVRRIIPLLLGDAQFGTWRDRLVYTKHWRTEFEEMELHFKDLAESDFRLYKAMQEWHNRIGDSVAYVNDVLSPHGFDEIVKHDFAALRQMLNVRSRPNPLCLSLTLQHWAISRRSPASEPFRRLS